MTTLKTSILCSAVLATSLAVSAPANAGVDISFGAQAPIGNDGQLFLSINSNYYDREPRVVETWAPRFPDPDDLAVFMHICAHTRTSPDVIFSYRRQGMPWFEISTRVGVPVDTWYVPVQTDPGPPYGKAYGYWRKHQRDPHYAVRLDDRQCRDLVAVRMAHDYYHVTPEQAMEWRRSGASVRTIMTREYRSRHVEAERHDHGDSKGHGHGHDDQGENEEHGHGHGHGRGHDGNEKH